MQVFRSFDITRICPLFQSTADVRHAMQTMFDLTGRVAIVSGSASGMGRAMALALAEAGADLLLADRNADGLRQTAETIAA